jgi:hypothetical protein
MEQVPYCNTVEDYEALLPWNVKVVEPMKKVA